MPSNERAKFEVLRSKDGKVRHRVTVLPVIYNGPVVTVRGFVAEMEWQDGPAPLDAFGRLIDAIS